jgi:hypothetical protein
MPCATRVDGGAVTKTSGARERIWLVTCALPGARASQRVLTESAIRHGGIQETVAWHLPKLKALEPFRRHPQLLATSNLELGLWKPAIILDQLRRVPDGDVVVYHDVGRGYWGDYAFRNNLAPIWEWAIRRNGGVLPGVWLPEDGPNTRWTTRYCFQQMQCDSEAFWVGPQIGTTFSVWQRNDRVMDLVSSWLDNCVQIYSSQRPEGTEPANFPDFIRDRGAQSILTNLANREKIECFGRPFESTAEPGHPGWPPIPASEIDNLLGRTVRAQKLELGDRAAPQGFDRPPVSGPMALFTSIPPRLNRSIHGFAIGEHYQMECVKSWRAAGFDVYSIHHQDELQDVPRLEGVEYVGVERSAEDDSDRKPSMRAILRVAQNAGTAIVGIINSDIFLVDLPSWTDVIRREIEDSVIVFSRYDTNDIDRTLTAFAPWGFDLVFLDPKYIDKLTYCGMRIGETYWDYWLPLWCYFAGAKIKHVDDFLVLHLDHQMVSNLRFREYALRLLDLLEREAGTRKAQPAACRLTEFYDYCTYRFKVEAARLQTDDRSSSRFLGEIFNPTVWFGIYRLLRDGRIAIFVKEHPHHRLLSAVVLRTIKHGHHVKELLNFAPSIENLAAHIQEIEADRAERLRSIETLSAYIQEIEADRAERLRSIETLTAHIQEIEADRAERLRSIETLTAHIQKIDADRAERLRLVEDLSHKISELGNRKLWRKLKRVARDARSYLIHFSANFTRRRKPGPVDGEQRR